MTWAERWVICPKCDGHPDPYEGCGYCGNEGIVLSSLEDREEVKD